MYVMLEPGGCDTQDVRADLALYLGSKLKLKQEEGLNVKLEVYFVSIIIKK